MSNLKAFYKANNFVSQAFKRYYKHSTRSEKLFDVFIAFLIAFFLVGIGCYYIDTTYSIFLKNLKGFNNIVITASSILAGFNVTSLSVIASSQSDLVTSLKNDKSKTDPTKSKFDILIIFFTWAIVIQLIIILIGIIAFFTTQFYVNELQKINVDWYVWLLLGFWLGLILHSLFISIRNVKMLYLFITK